jgi:electron-transferring-flavoprotein dehydrogenase
MCAWLAPQAEALGVEIYPGFAASETLHDETGTVIGVRIGDMGVAKDGSHKPGYTPGIDIRAKVTVLAEGARGHLTKRLVKQFKLDADSDPQGYSIGIKELWQVPKTAWIPARSCTASAGPRTARCTPAASCITSTRAASPWATSAGWITRIRNTSRGKPSSSGRTTRSQAAARRRQHLSAGARAIVTGGWQSLPKVEMPGALLIGDTAGLLNVPKIKGTHQAIRSGMLAAEHLVASAACA